MEIPPVLKQLFHEQRKYIYYIIPIVIIIGAIIWHSIGGWNNHWYIRGISFVLLLVIITAIIGKIIHDRMK